MAAIPVTTLESSVSAPHAVERAVRGDFIWMSAGNIVFATCQWAMVSALAKLGSPEMVGVYALGIAVTTPPLMLAQLNLRSVIATDARQEHHFADYRDLRAISVSLTLIGIAIFVVMRRSGQEALPILLIGLILGLQWMSDIYLGLLQARERIDRIAISVAMTGIVSLMALAITVRVSGSLNAGLSAVLLARLIVFLAYDSTNAVREYIPRSAPRRHWGGQLRILRTSLPLGAVMMIGSVTPNLPRYFIAHLLGAGSLGIFSALASLMAAANLLINALGQASTSRLANLYSAGNALEFKRLTYGLIAAAAGLGLAGAIAASFIGPQVLTILFRREYAAHVDLLVTLAIAAAVTYIASLLGYAITACRCFSEQVPLQVATVAVAGITCALLVPRYGLEGGALALAAASLVQILGECMVLRSALQRIAS